MGRAFAQRLVTQMYFPGDPFMAYDPIYNAVTDPAARERMVAGFRIHDTRPNWAHAYEWDVYLRGPAATVFEGPR
jgi:protocatechuate 3,4-dioxygenase beta subunit